MTALVVFGYGPVLTSPALRYGKLNVYGRINAIAAGMMYGSGNVGVVIPTGGKTGKAASSEAELIADILKIKFRVPEHHVLMEEKAPDTIYNLVYVANALDRIVPEVDSLAFTAMGFHLERISYLCTLLGLQGEFHAAELVVRERSRRHRLLLEQLLSLDIKAYSKLLADQERGMRGLVDLPEYWLPPMAVLENAERLRYVLNSPQGRRTVPRSVRDGSIDGIREWLARLPRRFPS